MKIFTKQGHNLIAVDSSAAKDMYIPSERHNIYEPMTTNDDEDIVFGSLAMYLNDDNKRRKKFWKH